MDSEKVMAGRGGDSRRVTSRIRRTLKRLPGRTPRQQLRDREVEERKERRAQKGKSLSSGVRGKK